MLFSEYLDSIKIDFYLVKGYSGGESYLYKISIKKANLDQYKDKISYDNSFKIQLRNQPKTRPRSYIKLIIDTSQCKDKIFILYF